MSELTAKEKLLKKAADNPSIPLGLTGLTGVVAYGLFNFRKRSIRPSIYLIHLRLAAQGTLMLTITLGLVYTLSQRDWSKLWNKKKEP
ncbi:hypothetical protein RUM44_004060 [Polyplax serrata]|uniref:HIG1 domain-containing protein n=1 Tax=Polyplax serrata TaxID=468196 RepID=A0ABR1B3B7_POLSC